MCIPYVLYYMGGRIIDSLQIDNRQIYNLTFSKVYSAIPLPCPHGLGNWQHGFLLSLSWVRLG